ncbi:MAG: hypothetical protein GKR90_00160 [Pseudomonadales bacterium]|nr:hypothetical protein [Pseudomonadales bacterium]
MIIFGLDKSFREGELVDGHCESCGHEALASVRGFRYFHLFWLPVVPLGSNHTVVCTHCQQCETDSDLSDDKKAAVKAASHEVSRPIWHFIGPILMTLLIVLAEFDSQELEVLETKAAAAPTVGDIWVIDVKEAWPNLDAPYRYGTAIVSSTENDNVELSFSDWYYNLPSAARKAVREVSRDEKSDYFQEEVWFERAELVSLQQAEHIQLVDL